MTRKEQLDELWECVMAALKQRLKDGSATAADIGNAIRFIKEGDIQALNDIVGDDTIIKELEGVEFDFDSQDFKTKQ